MNLEKQKSDEKAKDNEEEKTDKSDMEEVKEDDKDKEEEKIDAKKKPYTPYISFGNALMSIAAVSNTVVPAHANGW